MGGKAFATGSEALYTPRMHPEVYKVVLTDCVDVLMAMFPLTKSPIEAPEKTVFGDIDIITSLEGSVFTQEEIRDPRRSSTPFKSCRKA